MNYHALSRRELQALCKQHKIPANKTNVFMAESLTALLSVAEKGKAAEVNAPAKDASTELIAESMGEVVVDTGDSEDVFVISPDTINRRNRVDSGVEDMCSAVKPRTKRVSVRGMIAPLASLTATENIPNSKSAAEEKARLTFRAPRKPALKSKNARALVKAAIAPDSPGSDYAASSITQEDEPEVLEEVDFTIRCDRSQRLGNSKELEDRNEGSAGLADAEVLKIESKVGGNKIEIQGTYLVTEADNVILSEVVDALLPEGNLTKPGPSFAPSKEITVEEALQKVSSRRVTAKRTGTAKKAAVNVLLVTSLDIPIASEAVAVIQSGANQGKLKGGGRARKWALAAPSPVEMETLHAAPENVRHNGPHRSQEMLTESQAHEVEKSKPANKAGRKASVAPAALPLEQAPAIATDRRLNDVGNFHFDLDRPVMYELQEEKAAEPNLTSKKGMKAKNTSRVAQSLNEVEAAPAAFDKEKLCDDIQTKNPNVKEPNPATRKGKKAKKGARSTNPPVELEALPATVAEVEPHDGGTIGLAVQGHSANMAKEPECVEPKVATGMALTAKRIVKTKRTKAKASSPVLEVYVDTDLANKVVTDAVDPESLRRLSNHSDDPSSPVKSPSLAEMKDSSPMKSPSVSHMGEDSISPVKSPSLAHLVDNSPLRSLSLSHMENGLDCGSSDNESNESANQVALERSSVGTNTYCAREADKENSGRKAGTEVPKSLRKLRKQVKEATIKKNITPVSSPLKDISLNIRSPQPLLSTSFSFHY